MKLTELKIRTAKPKEKAYKLGDGGGLYMLVHPAGHKYWRMKYRFDNKEKLLAFGTYPEVSLAQAREKRFEARKLKSDGVDPGTIKQEQKRRDAVNNENSFESIAREWHEKKSSSWRPYYVKQAMQRLEKDIFPSFGSATGTGLIRV